MIKYLRMAQCALLLAALAALALPTAPPARAQEVMTEGYTSTIALTATWADLVGTYSGMASVPSFVHNSGNGSIVVFYGASASAPTSTGVIVKPGETVRGNAAHVWARTIGSAGSVQAGTVAIARTITGSVASGAADSGAPIKMGCVYNSSFPTFTTGQRGDCQIDNKGALITRLAFDGTYIDAVNGTMGDALTNTFSAYKHLTFGFAYNGATWDKLRGDTNGLAALPGLASTQWSYSSGATGILSNTTTAVTMKAAAGANVRIYVDSCQIITTAFGLAVPLAIRDGAGGTALWAGVVDTGGWTDPVTIPFIMPLKGTANTLLEVVTTTANVTGSVNVNCQGHTGAGS